MFDSSIEGDSKVCNLIGLLRNPNPILVLRTELDKKFLAILSWVGEDDVEVVEHEFFAFEGDLGCRFIVDLSFHRFDQIKARLIGLDLHDNDRTLKLTTLSTRLEMVISECISCSSRN